MMHLHIPLPHRNLSILIYARYSTEEQHPTSIQDQIDFCKEFLKEQGVIDARIEVLYDAEKSGELVSRPGINKVMEGILAKKWDVILVEDSGRFYRHETACGELIETAVDQDIRVLCLNDDVDTFEEDWEDRLHEAMRHHARANRFTAKRIKRKLEGLWRMGAAVGPLRPGYKRRPTKPATKNEPEEGPFFDEIDTDWEPVVYDAFERYAREEPPWLIGRWLTEKGLPKTANSTTKEWTERNVLGLIANPIYRGLEQYRVTVVRKQYRSGKHPQVRNDPEKVLTREMPHLRIVPDALWHDANRVRTANGAGPKTRGENHPMAGIPRDSRGPLTDLFFCGICGGKMYQEGRNKGGYRCKNAHEGKCWNKATALREIVHGEIGPAIVEQLLGLDDTCCAMVEHVKELVRNDEPRQRQEAVLKNEIAQMELACERLVVAIESGKDAPAVLAERLRVRTEDLARKKAELERLCSEKVDPELCLTEEGIRQKMDAVGKRLLSMDREAGAILGQFITPIQAVPCQPFGSNLVVLRAKFDLHLANFLPGKIFSYLKGVYGNQLAARLKVVSMTVDLFNPSVGPKLFRKTLELKKRKKTLVEIGKELGVSKRGACIAVQFGEKMEAAGLEDPYIELTEAPMGASRWRFGRRYSSPEGADLSGKR